MSTSDNIKKIFKERCDFYTDPSDGSLDIVKAVDAVNRYVKSLITYNRIPANELKDVENTLLTIHSISQECYDAQVDIDNLGRTKDDDK